MTTEDVDLHLQAQAMCVGIASTNTNANDALITAVSRPRINPAGNTITGDENRGAVSCSAICNTVPDRDGNTGTQQCFGGVHVYAPDSNEIKNNIGAAFPYQTVLYNPSRCDVDWFGPNYCCCN